MSGESPTLDDFFPAGEIAQAVDACRRQDRRLDMYHKFASPTAKAFVELGFYSTHFGDKVDPELYARCRDAIAPTLTEQDIRYLLRFETDPATKSFLADLLQRPRKPKLRLLRKTPAPAAPPPVAPQPLPSVLPANPTPRIPRRPRRVRLAVDMDLLKLLAALGAVGGILFFFAGIIDFNVFDFGSSDSKREIPTVAQTPEGPSARPLQTQEVETVRQSVKETTHAVQPDVNEPLSVADIEEPALDEPTLAGPTGADSNAVRRTSPKRSRTRTRKFVLTDGTSVKARPDGTIEVPREFSYAGASLKKPFWIYDRQLEKSGRIEYEARAVKAARDKWKALHDEAVKAANP